MLNFEVLCSSYNHLQCGLSFLIHSVGLDLHCTMPIYQGWKMAPKKPGFWGFLKNLKSPRNKSNYM